MTKLFKVQQAHPISGTFLPGTAHRDDEHCLGGVLANLRNRPRNVHSGTMDPHQTLMRTLVLLPHRVLGARVLLTHPNMGGAS